MHLIKFKKNINYLKKKKTLIFIILKKILYIYYSDANIKKIYLILMHVYGVMIQVLDIRTDVVHWISVIKILKLV